VCSRNSKRAEVIGRNWQQLQCKQRQKLIFACEPQVVQFCLHFLAIESCYCSLIYYLHLEFLQHQPASRFRIISFRHVLNPFFASRSLFANENFSCLINSITKLSCKKMNGVYRRIYSHECLTICYIAADAVTLCRLNL
jgi:hypothetical protein